MLNFQNRNPGDGLDWLGKAFPDMLLTHFTQHGNFQAVEREKMQSLFAELKLQQQAIVEQGAASEFSRIAKAQKVVYGHYAVRDGALEATAFILDAATQKVDSVATISGPMRDLCELERQLFARLIERLGQPLTPQELAALPCVISGNLDATTHFYQGLTAFDDGDYPHALLQFGQAAKLDRAYGEARLWMGKIYRALGEFEHAVIALRQFTRERPQHPGASEAHRVTGLVLLQDLQEPQLAIPEFERLSSLVPEASWPPARLREAHWNEYVLFAKKTNPPFWYTKEQQDADQKEFERLGKLAAERNQKFKLCVEGWYRLGQCWEQLGDGRKAFDAYDRARAISRWVLLDSTEPREINYAAYRAYEKLLATAEADVPVPDWVWRVDETPTQLLGGTDRDGLYRYKLIHPRWLLGDFVLLAPEGMRFTNVIAHVHSLSTDFPARYRLCIKNYQIQEGAVTVPDPFVEPIHCFPYYLGYDFMTNAFTKSFPIPGNQRAIVMRALGLDSRNGKFDSLIVEPSFAPLAGSAEPVDAGPEPTAQKAQCHVYYLPADAGLYLDGNVVPPTPEAGICQLILEPGRHTLELKKQGWKPVGLDLDLPANAERSVFLSLDSAWKDIGVRLPGCTKPHLSQRADDEFWLVCETPTRGATGGASKDISMMRSRDLLHWNTPEPVPISSTHDDRNPKVVHRGDSVSVLTFCSDRKKDGVYSLYASESTDGEHWSTPRLIAEAGADTSYSVVVDSEDRLWLLYPCDGHHCLRMSPDGHAWGEPRRIRSADLPFQSKVESSRARITTLLARPKDLLLLAVSSLSNRVTVTTFRSTNGAEWVWNNEAGYPDVLYGNSSRVNLTEWLWNGGPDWSRCALTTRGDYLALASCMDTTYAGVVRANGKLEPPHTLLRGFGSDFSPPLRGRDGRYLVCRALPPALGSTDYGISDGTRILACTEADLERVIPQQSCDRTIFWYNHDQFAYFDKCFWRGSSRHPKGLAVRSAIAGEPVRLKLPVHLANGTSNTLPARITIMRVHGDQLWIATGGYGLFVHQAKAEAVEEVRPPADGRCRTISALEVDGQKVWAGTETEGLYSYEKGSGRWAQCSPNAEIGKINALLSSSGRVWVGTGQGLWMYDGQSNQWAARLDKRPVQCLAASRDRLWIGGPGGLVECDFTSKRFRSVVQANVRCLQADGESLWIATASQGLHRMDLGTGELQYVSLDSLGYGERPRLDRISRLVDDGEHLLIGTDHLTEFIREIIRLRKTDAIRCSASSNLVATP